MAFEIIFSFKGNDQKANMKYVENLYFIINTDFQKSLKY